MNTEFLKKIAITYCLSDEQTAAFLARFNQHSTGTSEAKLASELGIGVAALKKRMTEVYDKLSVLCPDLKSAKRGKVEKLRAYLQKLYDDRTDAPTSVDLKSTAEAQRPLGVPFPKFELISHFVPRPEPLAAVKRLLLETEVETLTISAIQGLGGIGKSILAQVLIEDREIQEQFPDGVLWVTLGQDPEIQELLGQWIRELRDFDYKPTSVEAASQHLKSLLYGKQMLLVVDDAWNAAHVEPFRVGSNACRVLVTTREAVIPGSRVYPLDVMSLPEALALVKGFLGRTWRNEMETEALAFAKCLGYLPLALELAAVQVKSGLSWVDLQDEFRREVVDLMLLDSPEALQRLSAHEQRRYSLRACFNLSLRRLSQEQLTQFAWLGVLPEDVTFDFRMAATLWNVRPVQAKKALQVLRSRSLLTGGIALVEDAFAYRLHDLMHDTARSLIEETLELTLLEAQRQVCSRYRAKTQAEQWWTVEGDGYIHANLTWHLEQAEWTDEIHELLRASDSQGRNAWFEACNRLGQPAVFVQDVVRAWRLAEEMYERKPDQSIVFQVRYALIVTTLNSLASNIPAKLMTGLVKHGHWTIEQAWAYVEQIPTEDELANAITTLGSLLSPLLLHRALCLSQQVRTEYKRADVLSSLLQYLPESLLPAALESAQNIKQESHRANVLCAFAKYSSREWIPDVLRSVQNLQDEYDRAKVLSYLVQHDRMLVAEVLELVKRIQIDYWRAQVLCQLAEYDQKLLPLAVETTLQIQDHQGWRAELMCKLSQKNEGLFSLALDAVQQIQEDGSLFGDSRVPYLIELAKKDQSLFPEVLKITQIAQDKWRQKYQLENLIQFCPADMLAEILEIVQQLQDEDDRIELMSMLARRDTQLISTVLEEVSKLQDRRIKVIALNYLAEQKVELFPVALKAAQEIQDQYSQAKFFSRLTQHYPECLKLAVEVSQRILGSFPEFTQQEVWKALFEHLPINLLLPTFELAQGILSRVSRGFFLDLLVEKSPAGLFPLLLEKAQHVRSESIRVQILVSLSQSLPQALFSTVLPLVKDVEDQLSRCVLLDTLSAYAPKEMFSGILELALKVKDTNWRLSILANLAKHDLSLVPIILEKVQYVEDESTRSRILNQLAVLNRDLYVDALGAIQAIQDEFIQVSMLYELLPHLPEHLFPLVLQIVQQFKDQFQHGYLVEKLINHLPGHLFPSMLQIVQQFQNEHQRKESLVHLLEKSPASLVPLVLEIVQRLDEPSERVKILAKLSHHNSKAFSMAFDAMQELTDWEKAREKDIWADLGKSASDEEFQLILDEAQQIQDEDDRGRVLSVLAQQRSFLLPIALDAVQQIQTEEYRAKELIALSQHLPEELLSQALDSINAIQSNYHRATAISGFLTLLPLSVYSPTDWQLLLHLLANRTRPELLQDLSKLTPVIQHLGSDDTLRRTVEIVQEVCTQWK